MRPGQNKRMRGRNNNNNNGTRKGPNPLTRSYESNGPDVKIRGTAHHVAEKYLQLARDAQSSGDPVAAENYLQHAEHYFRLIASAQVAQAGYARPNEDIDLDDDEANTLPDRFASPAERVVTSPYGQPQPYGSQQNFQAPQPYGERQSYNGERPVFNAERQPAPERNERFDRNGNGYERPPRPERPNMGRGPRPYRDRDSVERGPDNRSPETRALDPREPRENFRDAVREAPREAPREFLREAPREPIRDLPPREVPRDMPREASFRDEPQPIEARIGETPRFSEPAPLPEPTRAVEPPRIAEPPRVAEAPRTVEPPRAEPTGLPAFITAPVRLTPPPASETAASAGSPATAAPVPAPAGRSSARSAAAAARAAAEPISAPQDNFQLDPAEEAARFPPRRRRRTRVAAAAEGDSEAQSKLPVAGD